MLEIIGAIFIIVFGTLGHFLYDWTDHNKIVGYFTAVNESTWEHLKLIIAPSLLWLIVEYHFYYFNPNLFFAKFVSMMVMLMIVPTIFYCYTHFTKKPILAVDITSFIFAICVGQYVFHILINIQVYNIFVTHFGIIGIIILFLKYITHTYVPDKTFLYKDPLTNKYGIKGHLKEEKHNHKHVK